MLLGGILLYLLTYAQTVKYIGCTPTDGSSIDEFKFTLTFDIAEAAESLGAGEWGLGYYGSSSAYYTTLYEGTESDGIELSKVNTANFTGKSEGFVVNGNTVSVVFPSTISPKENQLYTLVIRNNFVLFQNGKTVPKTTTALRFADNPLILTFTGKKIGEDKLALQEISVEDNSTLEVLKDIKYTFNTSITTNPDFSVSLKENDVVIAESSAISVEDGNTLVATFGDGINLSLGHSYNVILPAGAISMASDLSKTNQEYNFNVNGAKTYTFEASSITPAKGETCLPSQASIVYEIPDGTNITGGKGQAFDKSLQIYKSEVSEENLVKTLYSMNYTENSFIWDLTSISFEPSTKYILYREEGLNNLFYKDNNNRLPEWSNAKTNSYFLTPSIAEANIPPFVYQNPVNGQYEKTNTVLEPNSKVDYIGTFELALKDLNYQYEGTSYQVSINNDATLIVYDITGGQETNIGSATISTREVEPEDWHLPNYKVWRANIDTYFLEGHKYKLVIPAGTLSINYKMLKHYATNEEWSLELEGSTPTKVELTSCSLKDNDELSELASVKWTFKGGFVQNTNEYIGLKYKNKSGGLTQICLSVVTNYGSYTEVSAYLPATNTGEAYQFVTDREYQIIFPEGFIYYEGDPSIKNSEMVYNIIPVAKTPEVVEPEFVDVKIVTNDFMTTSQKAVKGKQFSYSMSFNSTEEEAPVCWEVKSVEPADMVLASLNGAIMTKPLNDATTLNIEVDYTGEWATNISSNVWEIKNDNPIQIFEEGGMIVIQGVTPENTICVYNVAGMLVNTTRTTEGNDIVRLSVSPGYTYIVTVDGVAAKIYVK